MDQEIKTNIYEISFLLNSAEDAEVVKKHLANAKAEIVNEGPVVSTKLSYPVKKIETAFFGYIHFKMATSEAAALNHALGLDTKVIRFLIITPPAEKPKPRMEMPRPVRKTASSKDLTNEVLEEKLAALQNNV